MMSCDTAKRMLSEYVDHALNEQDRFQVEAHLQQCPDCRKVFSDVEYLTQRLRRAQTVQVSADFDSQLRTRIMDDSQNIPEKGLPIRKMSFGFSGAVVVAAVTFFFFSQLSTPPDGQNSVSHSTMSNVRQFSLPVKGKPIENQTAMSSVDKISEDSLKNPPLPVDESKIKLVGQERQQQP